MTTSLSHSIIPSSHSGGTRRPTVQGFKGFSPMPGFADDVDDFFDLTNPAPHDSNDYIATTLRVQICSNILHHSNSNAVLLAEMLTNLASARVCDAYLYAYALFHSKQFDLALLVLKRYNLSIDFVGLQQLVANYTPPPTLDSEPGSLHRVFDSTNVLNFVSVHDLVVCMMLSMRCLIALDRFEEAIAFLGHGRSSTGVPQISLYLRESIDTSSELESILLDIVNEYYQSNYHLVNIHTFWEPIRQITHPSGFDDGNHGQYATGGSHSHSHQSYISGVSLLPQTYLHTVSQLCIIRAKVASESKKRLYYTSKAFFYDIYNIDAFKTIVDMEVVSPYYLTRLLKHVYLSHKMTFNHTQLIPSDYDAALYIREHRHHPRGGADDQQEKPDRLGWVLHLCLSLIKSKSYVDLDIFAARNHRFQVHQRNMLTSEMEQEDSDDDDNPSGNPSGALDSSDDRMGNDGDGSVNTVSFGRRESHSVHPRSHQSLGQRRITASSQRRSYPDPHHAKATVPSALFPPQEEEDIFNKLCGIQYHMSVLESTPESQGIGNCSLILSCQVETFYRQHVLEDAYKLAEFVIFRHDFMSAHSLLSTHCAETYALLCFELNYVDQLYALCITLSNIIPSSPTLWFCIVVYFLASQQYSNAKALLEGSTYLLTHPRVLELSCRLHFDVRHNDVAIMGLKQANLLSPAASWHAISLLTYQLHDIYRDHIDTSVLRAAILRHGCVCPSRDQVCTCGNDVLDALNEPLEYLAWRKAEGKDKAPLPPFTWSDVRLVSSLDLGVWALCGLIAYKHKRYDDALAWFTKAINITNHLTSATAIMADSSLPHGQPASAQVVKPRTVTGHLTLLINKAHTLRKLHRYYDAIDCYQDAVPYCAHSLQTVQCYLGIALSHHLSGNIIEAMQFYALTQAIDPANTTAERLIRVCSYTLSRS